MSMVEVHPDVAMMRAGTRENMVTMEIHHSYNKVDQNSKREYGKTLADFIVEQLRTDMKR